ncbi:hypothetical protein AaE_014675 [Aphanomyces astaci]|uniref:RCC1-like domain-containing protein n=1 Tax=Aphanomyces astaci TaxID=112090 RepID=A0A6A4Z4J8_APHAT|nr:hypothetical protein AaE_014675 [Aphanomyces astaci]
MRATMGWEGMTGHLYLSGTHEQSNGECKKYVFTQGRKIKAVYGNYSSLLALCDGWDFEWLSTEIHGLTKSLNDVKIHQLAFGKSHTIALSLDGHLFVWGDAQYGQLGLGGTITTKDHPSRLSQLDHIVFSSVACGGYHTAALSNSGGLYTWGRNFEGQLGHSSVIAPACVNEKLNGVFHRPKHVAAFLNEKCKQVACGDKFTVVLTVPGEIYSFGEGQSGQLGTGRCTKVFQPKLTLASDAPDDIFVEIACGWAHTLAITRAGRLYSWGFNQYGQLGVGDTKTRFLPQQVTPCMPVMHVSAGGNYSAAITREGRLLTWGNACHGKLAHAANADTSPVPAPTLVESLKDMYVQSVACSWNNILIFAPTWVNSIYVFITNDTIKLAMRQGVSCVLPKFSVTGEFAVEVAMNGKHFTTNGTPFEVFVAPTITHISHQEIRFDQTPPVHLTLTGDKPKAHDRPLIKWIPLNPQFAPIQVAGAYGRYERRNLIFQVQEKPTSVEVTPSKENQEVDPSDDHIAKFSIVFAPPAFNPTPSELVPCHLQVSFNGQDFDLVQLQGAPSPQIVYFHNATITRCTPNSMPLNDKALTVAIHVNQMFDIGALVCKATYREPHTENAPWHRVATANLSILSVKLDDQIIVCTVPAWSEWAVHTIVPEGDQFDSEDNTCQKMADANSSSTPSTFPFDLESFQAQVLVSVNGGATFLPPIGGSNVLHGYSHGTLTDVSPSSGPITGGTVVSMGASHLGFDTDDALVSVEYDGDLQTVPSFVRQAVESAHSIVTFQVPSFVPVDHDDNIATAVQPAMAFNPATIRLALSGTSFGESTVPFEFYRTTFIASSICVWNPHIRSIEPQLAAPGTMLTLTGSYLKSAQWMKCKVEKADGSFSAQVEAEYREDKAGPCYKVELQQLGAIADGELRFYVALNGQQYVTSDFAKFNYVDQPEVPLGKDDKRKQH